MNSRRQNLVLVFLVAVLAAAGSAWAQCGCDNPDCLNDCVNWGCVCEGGMPPECNCAPCGCAANECGLPNCPNGGANCNCAPCDCVANECGLGNCPGGGGPPPDCTCGLPNCFGMGCFCGVGLCECPGQGLQCMYCNSGCPPPDPRCTGAVACSSPDGCGNEQDCFCDSTYCENDGPMCCMGGQKIVCHESGCGGYACATQGAPACGNTCTEQSHCANCDGTMCMCEGEWIKNCADYCGLPPCGGTQACEDVGCTGDACDCNGICGAVEDDYPCKCGCGCTDVPCICGDM